MPSKYRGVTNTGGKVRAFFQHQGQRSYLGTFKTEEEAARAYDARARELGAVVPLNFPDPAQGEHIEPQLVRTDKIEDDLGLQSREQIYPETIAEYHEALTVRKERLPPVTLVRMGSRYILAKGFHRLGAYKAAGIERIPAEVIDGDLRDAKRISAASNATHGRQRSNADKEAAVRLLLTEPEWAGLSSHALAEMARVSAGLVERVRGQLQPKEQERTGKDGRRRRSSGGKAEESNGQGFDWQGFYGFWGGAYRAIDKLGNLHGAKDTPEAEGLRRRLEQWKKDFKEWYTGLAKAKPPEK